MDTNLEGLQRELVNGLATELAGVVGALLGGTATATPAAGDVGAGWAVRCSVAGPLTGLLTLAVSDADATMLARRLIGMNEDPAEDAVADTIGEVAGQAAGGLGQQPVALGSRIRVDGAPSRGGERPAAPVTSFDVTTEDGVVFRFGCWAAVDVEQAAAAAPAPAPQVAAAPVAPPQTPAKAPAPATPNLDVILDIELPLTVRFGRAEMSLQSLTKIGPGSVIDLDRSPDEPVEVLINDKVIARGEVVVVAGNYGVRITEVASAADRIRTLG